MVVGLIKTYFDMKLEMINNVIMCTKPNVLSLLEICTFFSPRMFFISRAIQMSIAGHQLVRGPSRH